MVDNSGGGDFGPGAGQSGMGTRPDRHFGHHCKLAKLGQIGHYCHSRLQWTTPTPFTPHPLKRARALLLLFYIVSKKILLGYHHF